MGLCQLFSTLPALTHLSGVHTRVHQGLVGGRRTEKRHYLMIIEIMLYNHASLTAGHQSVVYSTLVRATTRVDLRMGNFRLALFARPPLSPLIRAKTPAEASGFSLLEVSQRRMLKPFTEQPKSTPKSSLILEQSKLSDQELKGPVAQLNLCH